ncbi:unnamed protein product [Notodromas monacha]|uniref:Uncharacterized protein n=1 Tax=Notodromas monacha TaxID=399045 RepID=A0A7R9BYV7_9CRUS|nr:unnamed protein product [Notodromas monacha]CAG0922848.1 unnamed protein product [Notodromas monacha]
MQPVSVLSFVDPMDELNQLDFGFTSDIDSRFSDDSPPDYRASMGLQDGLLAAFASNDDLIPSPICAKNQGTEEAREQFLPAILSFEDNFDIPVADELSYDINEFPQVNDFGMMSDAGFGLGSPPQTVPQTPPPLIPTTVLEITRNETIVGNGCGANVSINDEPNQHFLLRKFLSDGSSFADERQEFEKALLLSTDYSDVKIESGVSSPADFGQQAAETQVDFFDVDTMMQSTTSPESAQYDDADLEPIFSNLMHHMRTEFEGTCSLLQISTKRSLTEKA